MTQPKVIAALALLLVTLLILRSLYKRNASAASPLDFDDLLLGEDGKMSKAAAVMFGSFFVTTWIVIVLTLRDKMDGTILGVYVAAWVAPTVTRLIVGPKAETTTNTVTATSTTTTPVPPATGASA